MTTEEWQVVLAKLREYVDERWVERLDASLYFVIGTAEVDRRTFEAWRGPEVEVTNEFHQGTRGFIHLLALHEMLFPDLADGLSERAKSDRKQHLRPEDYVPILIGNDPTLPMYARVADVRLFGQEVRLPGQD